MSPFISHDYFKKVVRDSPFFARMTQVDLIARQAATQKEYEEMYVNSYIPFTPQEKTLLKHLISKIDAHLDPFKNINNIAWKLCKIEKTMEKGYPHTLEDVIILSPRFFDMNKHDQETTLLHEKIHVFQRKYPIETHKLILDVMGFQIKKPSDDMIIHRRNNPDLNELTYGKDDYHIMQVYNSFSPKDISDSKTVMIKDNTSDIINRQVSPEALGVPPDTIQLEHPYEIMASYLPQMIIKKKMNAPYMRWLHESF
jgi:hypothetical protein